MLCWLGGCRSLIQWALLDCICFKTAIETVAKISDKSNEFIRKKNKKNTKIKFAIKDVISETTLLQQASLTQRKTSSNSIRFWHVSCAWQCVSGFLNGLCLSVNVAQKFRFVAVDIVSANFLNCFNFGSNRMVTFCIPFLQLFRLFCHPTRAHLPNNGTEVSPRLDSEKLSAGRSVLPSKFSNVLFAANVWTFCSTSSRHKNRGQGTNGNSVAIAHRLQLREIVFLSSHFSARDYLSIVAHEDGDYAVPSASTYPTATEFAERISGTHVL